MRRGILSTVIVLLLMLVGCSQQKDSPVEDVAVKEEEASAEGVEEVIEEKVIVEEEVEVPVITLLDLVVLKDESKIPKNTKVKMATNVMLRREGTDLEVAVMDDVEFNYDYILLGPDQGDKVSLTFRQMHSDDNGTVVAYDVWVSQYFTGSKEGPDPISYLSTTYVDTIVVLYTSDVDIPRLNGDKGPLVFKTWYVKVLEPMELVNSNNMMQSFLALEFLGYAEEGVDESQ